MSFIDRVFRKKSGNDIQPSRQILFDILKTMRAAVIITTEDMRIIASNHPAYDAFARKNGALETKRLSEVIRDRSVHEAFQNAFQTGQTTEAKFDFLFGKKRTFSVRITPIVLDGVRCATGIFYELTQIEHLEKVRQEFFSNVSHELRTPLTSILAFVETLEDGAIDDEQNKRRFLSVIRKNAERMHHLIDDISELSSIEAGKINIEPKQIKLASLIDEIFINLTGKAATRNIVLINSVDADKTVLADRIRIEQMMTNLIDNAVKFNREGGSITATCESKNSSDIITITDEGEGISSEHLPRIFERFYRVDRARSREIGGTGLGLAIVKHLARLHGGEASVVSSIGKGSSFSIELPAKNPEAEILPENLSQTP